MIQEIIVMLQEINPYVNIDEHTLLIEEEILDSMGLLILITELEKKYKVQIPLDDLRLENFSDVNCIIKFIESLR